MTTPNKNSARHILYLSDHHLHAARLKLQGMRKKEIAKYLGYPERTVGVWFRSKVMKLHMQELHQLADQEAAKAAVHKSMVLAMQRARFTLRPDHTSSQQRTRGNRSSDTPTAAGAGEAGELRQDPPMERDLD